jgi:hypothetical protein
MPVLYPESDVEVTGWTPSTGVDVYAVLDEPGAPDDGDYATAQADSNPALTLGGTWTVPPGTTHRVRVRTAVTEGAHQVRALLLNGSNVEQGASAWTDIDATVTTHLLTVTTTGDAVRCKVETQAADTTGDAVIWA